VTIHETLMPTSCSDMYSIRAIVRAAEVLRAFENSGEILRLCDITRRISLDKATSFRLVQTLCGCGFLQRVADNRYRCSIRLHQHTSYRIGFAAGGDNSLFNREVTSGLIRAAQAS